MSYFFKKAAAIATGLTVGGCAVYPSVPVYAPAPVYAPSAVIVVPNRPAVIVVPGGGWGGHYRR